MLLGTLPDHRKLALTIPATPLHNLPIQPSRWRHIVYAYAGLLAAGAGVVWLVESSASFLDALFLTISAITLTGISPIPFDDLDSATRAVLAALIMASATVAIVFCMVVVLLPKRSVSDRMQWRLCRGVFGLLVCTSVIGGLALLACHGLRGTLPDPSIHLFNACSSLCGAGFSTTSAGTHSVMDTFVLTVLIGLGTFGWPAILVRFGWVRHRDGLGERLNIATRNLIKIIIVATIVLAIGRLMPLCYGWLGLGQTSNNANGSMTGVGTGLMMLFESSSIVVNSMTCGLSHQSLFGGNESMGPGTDVMIIGLMLIGGGLGSASGGGVILVMALVLRFIRTRGCVDLEREATLIRNFARVFAVWVVTVIAAVVFTAAIHDGRHSVTMAICAVTNNRWPVPIDFQFTESAKVQLIVWMVVGRLLSLWCLCAVVGYWVSCLDTSSRKTNSPL